MLLSSSASRCRARATPGAVGPVQGDGDRGDRGDAVLDVAALVEQVAGLVLFVLGFLGRWVVWPLLVDGPPDNALGSLLLTGYSLLLGPLSGSLVTMTVVVVAWRQHDLALALWAAAGGLVLGLAGFFVIGNRMSDILRFVGVDSARWSVSWDSLAVLTMGVALLVAATGYRRTARKQPA